MNILNQPVLCLNANWQALQTKTVKEAITAMNGGENGKNPPALALDLEFEVGADGEIDWNTYSYVNPVPWAMWVKLPIRDHDMVLHTGKMSFRAPRIIIQPNFAKMPTYTPKVSKENIRKRDGGICQYTGEAVSWNDGNIDHVNPRDKGGKSTFENLVWCKKDVNSKKGNKTNVEAGLRLIRKPVAPRPVPRSANVTVAHHPSWQKFLDRVTEVREHKAS